MRMSKRTVMSLVGGALLVSTVTPALAGPPGGSASRPTIAFSKSAQSVAENAGSATITVTRSGKLSQLTGTSTVDYATTGGSAVAGGTCGPGVDYVTTTGTLTFPPSAVTRTFTVPICDEHAYDLNETINLALSNITNANYGNKKTMVLTITETNPAPVLTIGNAAPVVEGGVASFPVHFSGTTLLGTPVHVTTVDGTAVAGVNFTPIGTAFDSTIPPGSYSDTLLGNVTVSTLNDNTYTGPLNFTVVVTATNANVSGSPATGTITDAGPVLSVAGASAWQGSPVGFPVALSYQVPYAITFHWTTQANGSGTAGADCTTNPDFVTSSGDITIPANTPAGQVAALMVPTCPPADSTVPALDTTFSVHLSTLSNASVGPDAAGLIKSTVPYQTIVQTNPTSASNNTVVTETVTVTNLSGDGLPGVAVRGELYRDFDNPTDFGETDGQLIANTNPTVLTDSNGQVISSYTDTNGVTELDYLVACVPGFAGATTTDCGVTGSSEGSEVLLNLPAPPSTTGWTTESWTP